MLKRTIILIIFLILPVLTASAVRAQEDPAAARVGGVPIPESLVTRRMHSAGGTASSDDEAALAETRRKTLLTLIAEQACINEAKRLGLDQAEETKAETERRYGKMIEAVESYVRSSYPNLDREAMDEQVDALLKVLGESRETYRETAERSALVSALENYWLSLYPEPSDEEVLDYYDELYSIQKERFDADENAFESAMLNGELVVYRPVDLKLIRKAEFLFSESVITFLRQARQLGVSNLDAQVEAHYHALADEVEPVYEALLNGETTFDEVLEDLEPGSSAKVNYFHPDSTRFAQDYYDRAATFTEIGEISTAYMIPNGYAVLEYYGDLPAGVVPAEEAADRIREAIIREASKEYLTGLKQQLLDQADIQFGTD